MGTMKTEHFSVDAVILGGGAAGLWLLDDLVRKNYNAVLVESKALGSGQTVAAQGIIHGGFKYSLKGILTPSARRVSEMPKYWRDCLDGNAVPDLSGVRRRADFCHLWTTDSLTSSVGMMGASLSLSVRPIKLALAEVPECLSGCRSAVYRLDEPVIDPESFVETLAGFHPHRIFQVDAANGIQFTTASTGQIESVSLTHRSVDRSRTFRPTITVFAAGLGNVDLRRQVGLPVTLMQRRSVQVIVARGDLPAVNGHCIDGAATRLTITSDTDQGRTLWQIGGTISEDGVSMEPTDLVKFAKKEIGEVLPGIELKQVQWMTYRVDKAEATTKGGARPDDATVFLEGNVITAWPTKLALVPRLTDLICARLSPPSPPSRELPTVSDWPRPPVAQPPWKETDQWYTDN